MSLIQVLIILACALMSGAQSTTTSSAVPTHTVAVGADPNKFTPNQVNASIGDIIEFRFYPANHSVARAEYLLPCIPYEVTGINKVGFWSGFKPISIVGVDQPSYQVRVNDTNPMFYYCGAPGACLVDGMVGSVNANATETWEVQHAFALNSTEMFVPGQYFEPEGVQTSSSTSQSATSTSTTSPSSTISSLTSSTTTSANPGQSTVVVSGGNSSGLSSGAIAGIAIGVVAIALLAAALFYMYGRQKTMKEVFQSSRNEPGLPGRGSYLSGHMSPMSEYPPSGHKSPIVNLDEHSSYGRDRYSGSVLIGPQHERNNLPDSESYRSRSPPIDERDRDVIIPPLNVNQVAGHSPTSALEYERQHDSVGSSYLTPTPRGHFTETNEGHNIRPLDSGLTVDETPTALTAVKAGPLGTRSRPGLHEMAVPSRHSSVMSP